MPLIKELYWRKIILRCASLETVNSNILFIVMDSKCLIKK